MLDLIKKLKLIDYKGLPILNCPEDLKSYFTGCDLGPLKEKQAVVVVFTLSHDEFFKALEELVTLDPIEDKGRLLICYPKKGNPHYPSYVHRDEIFVKVRMNQEGFIYESPYMINRMLGFDENFTLLEIKKDQHFKPNLRPSYQGSDYIHHIPEVEVLLINEPVALKFYQELAPGYRKDWAVYLFSTQNIETRQRRVQAMIRLLNQGYKNMTLYRQSQKQ